MPLMLSRNDRGDIGSQGTMRGSCPWSQSDRRRSLRDGRHLDREFLRDCCERGVGCGPFLMLPFVSAGRERPPPQRGIPLSAQAIGLGHGRNHQGVAPTGRPSSSFVIVDDVFRVGPIESRPVEAV